MVRDDFLPEPRGGLGPCEPSRQHSKKRGGEDVEQRVPGGLNDEAVKGLIATCQLCRVAVTRVEEGCLEGAELRVTCSRGGKLGRGHFNQLANLNELTYRKFCRRGQQAQAHFEALSNLGRVGMDDERATRHPPRGLDQVFAGQNSKRLTDGRTRQAVLCGQVGFHRKAITGMQMAVEDLPT